MPAVPPTGGRLRAVVREVEDIEASVTGDDATWVRELCQRTVFVDVVTLG
jgi:hypothetical protein